MKYRDVPKMPFSSRSLAPLDSLWNGHTILMEKGQPAFGYMLGGDNLTVRAFINQIAQITNRPAPLIDLPSKLVDKAISPLKWFSSMTIFGGIDPQTFEMGCHYWYISSTRAQELGFQPRPLSETDTQSSASIFTVISSQWPASASSIGPFKKHTSE